MQSCCSAPVKRQLGFLHTSSYIFDNLHTVTNQIGNGFTERTVAWQAFCSLWFPLSHSHCCRPMSVLVRSCPFVLKCALLNERLRSLLICSLAVALAKLEPKHVDAQCLDVAKRCVTSKDNVAHVCQLSAHVSPLHEQAGVSYEMGSCAKLMLSEIHPQLRLQDFHSVAASWTEKVFAPSRVDVSRSRVNIQYHTVSYSIIQYTVENGSEWRLLVNRTIWTYINYNEQTPSRLHWGRKSQDQIGAGAWGVATADATEHISPTLRKLSAAAAPR